MIVTGVNDQRMLDVCIVFLNTYPKLQTHSTVLGNLFFLVTRFSNFQFDILYQVDLKTYVLRERGLISKE